MNKNLNRYLLLLFVFLTLLCGCAQETLTIGFSASLSGTTSELGVTGRNGLNLAIEAINSTGGVNGQRVNIIVKDDKNDPEIALKVDRELHESGVKFILGHTTSNMAKLSLPFVNENDLLMISPSMSSQELSALDDHLLRVVSSNELETEFMAGLIQDYFNCKKIALLYETKNDAYTVSFKNYLTRLLEENGSQIVQEIPFESGNDPAYFKSAEKIIASEADSIVILSSSFDAALFCQQFYKLNNDRPIFLPTWAMNNDLILQGGPGVEGVNIVSFFDPDSTQHAYLDFKENYRQAYHEEPSFSAVYTYEAAMILFDAIDKSQTTKPEVVKKTILQTKTYQGLQNEINFDAFGDATREIYHYTVKNGQFEKVKQWKKIES